MNKLQIARPTVTAKRKNRNSSCVLPRVSPLRFSIGYRIFFILIAGIMLGGCFHQGLVGEKTPLPQKVSRSTPEAVEIKPPEVNLTASGSNSVILKITDLDGFTGFEYTISYVNDRGASQGSYANVDLSPGQTSYSKEILLGICSAGRCVYDRGVEEIDLQMSFKTSDGKIKTFSKTYGIKERS